MSDPSSGISGELYRAAPLGSELKLNLSCGGRLMELVQPVNIASDMQAARSVRVDLVVVMGVDRGFVGEVCCC